jgi:hypothetical protein
VESTSLVVNSDGTAFDPATGLIWMIPLLGQGWSAGVVVGEPATMSWDEVTHRFGEGRCIAATASDCNWEWGSEGQTGSGKTAFYRKYPLNRETYDGYRVGKGRLDFAGAHDWRMPTVEELWSLGQANPAEPTFSKVRTWTATSSTKGLLAALGMSYHASWLFQYYGPCAFGDMQRDLRECCRLVRSGRIFELCGIWAS